MHNQFSWFLGLCCEFCRYGHGGGNWIHAGWDQLTIRLGFGIQRYCSIGGNLQCMPGPTLTIDAPWRRTPWGGCCCCSCWSTQLYLYRTVHPRRTARAHPSPSPYPSPARVAACCPSHLARLIDSSFWARLGQTILIVWTPSVCLLCRTIGFNGNRRWTDGLLRRLLRRRLPGILIPSKDGNCNDISDEVQRNGGEEVVDMTNDVFDCTGNIWAIMEWMASSSDSWVTWIEVKPLNVGI